MSYFKMSIKPTQKIVFINNKWGVGKTTLSYNVACKMSDRWYKTLLVDADPQCNLTLLALWAYKYNDLGLFEHQTIYNVVQDLIKWTWDINIVQPLALRENLDILPGNLDFNNFDDLLTTSFWEILTWGQRWFTVVSALQRYFDKIALDKGYQLIIIDVSPSMTWSLNKTILFSSDFFITICNPDLFSRQWVINLWTKIRRRRDEQKSIQMLANRDDRIAAQNVPKGNHDFLWYVLNNYNVYWGAPMSTHQERLQDIEPTVYEYLCELTRNWLVNKSKEILWMTQDYGKVCSLAQKQNKPVYELNDNEVDAQWTTDVLHKAQTQFEELSKEIAERLEKRWV